MNRNTEQTHIWYLYHSGFAVKTREHFLVFDYYMDQPRGRSASLDSGVINPDEIRDLDVVVFSSHEHRDHFNPVVLKWRERIQKIRYVLSYDIELSQDAADIIKVHPGKMYEPEGMRIHTLDSTDAGVAFLVEVDGLVIYHAGDLNWWHWEGEPDDENASMAENYKKQIGLLAGRHIDIAFIPLDPRLEEQYLLGLDYFMKTAGAGLVFPMHFGNRYNICRRLRSDARAAGYAKKAAEINRRGQHFIYTKAE